MQQWEYIGLTFDVVVPGLGRMGPRRLSQEDGTRVDG